MITPHPDQRTCPSVKGADLDHLTRLRQSARAASADEALILSPDGRVREGSTRYASAEPWGERASSGPATGEGYG
ncbi:hypothetical protein [Streptomyces sp. 7N604]|uniref:hypothetical protein n=1 Tax=Streptomyces sp. 7N604 TaxID=3457415 RepID=UPI003FD0DA85